MNDFYIETYGNQLFGFCIHLTKHKTDAEDLYQETWIKAYKFFHQYDPDKEFMGWLTTICINTYRDMLRKNNIQKMIIPFKKEDTKEFVMANQSYTQHYPSENDEIKKAIDLLPEKYKLVILLHYYYHYKTKEMADILATPEGTIKYRLKKARLMLKERIEIDG